MNDFFSLVLTFHAISTAETMTGTTTSTTITATTAPMIAPGATVVTSGTVHSKLVTSGTVHSKHMSITKNNGTKSEALQEWPDVSML